MHSRARKELVRAKKGHNVALGHPDQHLHAKENPRLQKEEGQSNKYMSKEKKIDKGRSKLNRRFKIMIE